MPDALGKAHEALDRAVGKSYRSKGFATERERFEFLFGLYEKLVAPAGAGRQGRPQGQEVASNLTPWSKVRTAYVKCIAPKR